MLAVFQTRRRNVSFCLTSGTSLGIDFFFFFPREDYDKIPMVVCYGSFINM